MFQHRFSPLLLAAVLMLTTACQPTKNMPTVSPPVQEDSGSTAPSPIVIKIGSQSNESSSEIKVLQHFEALVEKNSDDAIDIQIHPSSQLGSLRDLMSGLSIGTIEMATIGINSFSVYCPDFAVYDLWSFRTPDDFIRLYNSPVGARLNDELRTQSGIRILSYNLCSTGRVYFWGNKKVESVVDYQGLRIRTNSSSTNAAAVSAFGAIPTVVAWADMYTALQSNLLDIGSGDVENILLSGYASIVTYRYDGPENFLGSSVCISEKVWETLTPELQQILQEAAVESCQVFGNNLYEERSKEAELALSRAGIETLIMTPGEKELMREKIDSALAAHLHSTVSEDLLNEVQSVLSS